MSTPALRPAYWLTLRPPPARAMDKLAAGLADTDPPVVVQRTGTHMTVTVGPALRHFWSPWMQLEFGPATHVPYAAGGSDGTNGARSGTRLHARFSPAPSIWTGFMFLYVTLATLAFFGLMFAVAQLMMAARPTMLWAAAACVAACLGLWAVSLTGQRFAHDQIVLLRELLHQAFDGDVEATA